MTVVGTWIMADILWRGGGLTGIEIALLILFVPLFGNICLGFLQATLGFFIMLLPRDPFLISNCLDRKKITPDQISSTAIVAPIYNEDVTRVYEGIRSIYLSLVKTGCIDKFSFFILSDSSDPNKWIEEEVAWVELCKQLNAFGKIFYRKRNIQLNSKSGNISDFCRRWGAKYKHMIILDADSLMEGDTIVSLARLMELNPKAGIIQSVPVPVQSETFYSRMMQFAGTIYGPIYQAGLNFWMAANGNYWGHNAIIRLAPFIEHCSLPFMPGTYGSKSKRFMSHDYIEAALMARAGYEVWLAYDIKGSFENLPPTLIDNAKRDKRWCRGNLQHNWMLFAEGLHPINRLHLLFGIMSYLSSPLWLLFLIIGIFHFHLETYAVKSYDYDIGVSPFLDEICEGKQSLYLFIFTMIMLTLPKFLSGIIQVLRCGARTAGGFFRLFLSITGEHLISALTAPIHMLFNTKFVLHVLMGLNVPWGVQRREMEGVDWQEIIITHWFHTLVGISLAVLTWFLNKNMFYWLSPVYTGLIISIPLSILLSDSNIGAFLKRIGIFISPQEIEIPPVVAHLEKNLKAFKEKHANENRWSDSERGIMQAILDPYVNAIHVSLLLEKRKIPHKVTENLQKLEEKLLKEGPHSIGRREQMALLRHAEVMSDLHKKVWQTPEKDLAEWWRTAIRYYNTLSIQPSSPLYR